MFASRCRRLVALLVTLLVGTAAHAQTLAPGDVALVGMYADNPDQFAFVALTTVPGGTEIRFTDNGWTAAGTFRANEGVYVYTVPGAGLAAGDVVVVSEPAGPAFSSSGDQVLAYQGSDDAPSFVYALNVEGAAEWQSDATSSNTSALPTGLVNGATAVAVDEFDNVAYAGPTAGSRADLLAAIGDPANWTGDDGGTPPFPAAFTVTDQGGNLAPAFTAVPADQDLVQGVAFTFDYDADDADGDALTYSLAGPPAGAAIEPATGVFTWTPTADQAGQAYTVVAVVSDGAETDEAVTTFTVLAEAENQAPAFEAPAYGALAQLMRTFTLDYDAVDPDGDAVTYRLVAAPEGAAIDEDTGVLTWEAQADVGLYEVVVEATDGALGTRVRTFVAVQGLLFPGLRLAEMRAAIRDAYTPARTLGYDVARDTLYAEVSAFPDGFVSGVYTGYTVELPAGQDPSSYLFSRDINAEHVWPQSMGAGDEPQRSDMHILYPARAPVNSARGNKPYAEIPDAETDTWYYLDFAEPDVPSEPDLWSESDADAFEPREAVKGDVARAALYFYAVYEGPASESFFDQIKGVLDAWDRIDPVTAEEVVRSGRIARYQGNVNPFILDPTLAARMLGTFLATDDDGALPTTPRLEAAYPNPFNPQTTVGYTLPTSADVRLAVYDVLGREVAVLVDDRWAAAGRHEVPWNAAGQASGLYLVRLEAAGQVQTRRVTLVK